MWSEGVLWREWELEEEMGTEVGAGAEGGWGLAQIATASSPWPTWQDTGGDAESGTLGEG